LKDLQQYSIIKQMGKELFLASEIVGVPTKREASGLAMSSRNTRLSDQGKSHAAVLYKALSIVQEYYQAGEKPEDAVQKGKAILEQSEAKVEYLELVLLDSLSPVQIANEKQKKAVCVAAEIENVRLIDNLIFS
jgi:pantoate--beta-alanine ligase